jgi:hypothetical protein
LTVQYFSEWVPVNESPYLDDEYEERILEYTSANPKFCIETVRELFIQQCEKFQDLFVDDASTSAVQDVAWRQTKHRLQQGKLPENIKKNAGR